MSDLTDQRDLTITDGSTNTTLTGLEDDTVYHFTVMATDDATESVAPSNIVIARTGNTLHILAFLKIAIHLILQLQGFPLRFV